jgi:hypothetical protein
MVYGYLTEKIEGVDRRAREGENVLDPLTMSRMRIGDHVAVIDPTGREIGYGRVIKASPKDVEVPMAGEYMVFVVEDADEWHNAGFRVEVA